MGDLVGHTLGPYRLLEQLGIGGMATVYKAYHAAMDRYVAIKVLPQHLARDAGFLARFEREARTIARLEHRYILPVYDVAKDDDIPYLVMRYTDGGDLSRLVVSGQLSIRRAIEIISQVAEALAYAHRQGVIHRDVKPANILISREGSALLADFGIAKIYEDTLQLTGEGGIIGTPAYMAPEQLQGQGVDQRTDIYALGVVLYQALTGECPFIAETPLAVALMHIHNPLRPPREINPAIPESLERIILRAMAKKPTDRFSDANEMAEMLKSALAEMSAPSAVMAPSLAPPQAVADVGASPSPALPPSAPATAVLAPNAPPADPAPAQPVAPPIAHSGARRIWLLAGGAALALMVIGLVAWLLSGRSAPIAAVAPAGPMTTPRSDLRVLSDTSTVYDLAAVGDTVWAATPGGLVRYSGDGTSRVFTVADGLPANSARTILAAPDGTLWAADYEGVAHFPVVADGLGKPQVYPLENFGQIYTLMSDSDGSIWAGSDHGLRRFDGTAWRVPDLPQDDPALKDAGSVQTLFRDRDGALWIGLEEGLLRWKGGRWTRFSEAQGIGKAPVHKLAQSDDGTLWAAAGGAGLLRYDATQDRWQATRVSHDGEDFRSIVRLADGRLLATNDADIAELPNGGPNWTPITPPEQYAGWAGEGSLAQDASGRVWVNAGVGVSYLQDGQWHMAPHKPTLPIVQVGKLVAAADGKFWAIEAYGGRVAIVDPVAIQAEPFTGLDARITSVAFTQDTVWLGTSDGLVRQRDGATLRFTTDDGLPDNGVRELLATDTSLWVGTQTGLARYDLKSETFDKAVPEFDGAIVAKLFRAPDGAIWAGSQQENGDQPVVLGRYDGQAWQFWHPGDAPLPDGSAGATALAADAQGHVWLALWNGGVHRWDGAAWKTWVDADGAPSGNVLAIIPHANDLLLGGSGGQAGRLSRWNASGWSNFKLDGLVGPANDLRFTADGALWIATESGLLRISPEGVAALR
jgi:ligand-binding sensor domain-containing protein